MKSAKVYNLTKFSFFRVSHNEQFPLILKDSTLWPCSICLAKLAIGEFGEKYVVLFATVSSPKLTMTKRMTTESSPDLANFAIITR